jgi:hypothetical protein
MRSLIIAIITHHRASRAWLMCILPKLLAIHKKYGLETLTGYSSGIFPDDIHSGDLGILSD